MLPITTYIDAVRSSGVDPRLEPPRDQDLSRLFINSGWAHLIDPDHFAHSPLEHDRHVPAQRFLTFHEQQDVVTKALDVIMRNMDIHRDVLASLEWSLNDPDPLNRALEALTPSVRRTVIEHLGQRLQGLGVATGLGPNDRASSWSATHVTYRCPHRQLISSTPIRTSPQKRASERWSATTQAMMSPTESHAIRINLRSGILAICRANNATTSSKSRVYREPGRAQRTAS